MFLLAPQVAYLLPQLKNKYGNKIFIIDSLDFATNDFNAIIKKQLINEALDKFNYFFKKEICSFLEKNLIFFPNKI